MSEHTTTTYELHEAALTFADLPVGIEFADDCGRMCQKTTKESAFVYPLTDYMYFGQPEKVYRVRKKIVTTSYE